MTSLHFSLLVSFELNVLSVQSLISPLRRHTAEFNMCEWSGSIFASFSSSFYISLPISSFICSTYCTLHFPSIILISINKITSNLISFQIWEGNLVVIRLVSSVALGPLRKITSSSTSSSTMASIVGAWSPSLLVYICAHSYFWIFCFLFVFYYCYIYCTNI